MSNIVVTGATGSIGRRVVEGLVEKRERVTALVRDAQKARALEAVGAGLALGTFEDPRSLEQAFARAETVVLITAAGANAAEQAVSAIDVAKRSGVRKIVRISALKAAADGPTDNTRQHARTEAALAASGLTRVVLRPHFFMQNVLGSLTTISNAGKIYWGTGDGRLGMIDTRDIADAAIVAATSSAHDGATLELTGPASIDFHEVARAVARGLGRDVTFVPVPPEAAAQAVLAAGADEWTAGIIRDYCRAYASGWGDYTTGEVERLTGHPARSLDDFVREVLVPAARTAGS